MAPEITLNNPTMSTSTYNLPAKRSAAAFGLSFSFVILELYDIMHIGMARCRKISFSIFHSPEIRSPAPNSHNYLLLLLLLIRSSLENIRMIT